MRPAPALRQSGASSRQSVSQISSQGASQGALGGCAAMQQIAEWLEKLGMSEYAERFTENGISVAALRHLTDQDLKDIGVLLGHRRIVLAAIAEFAGASPEAPKTDSAKEPKALDTGERRQVSVLFSG